MDGTGSEAGRRVGRMYDAVQEDAFGDPLRTARIEFDAWHALSESIRARRRVKSAWYVPAVVGLLLEVAAAIYTALSLTPAPQ
jgi:hypothetical protein